MDLGEDVKKLTAFISQQKSSFTSSYELELEDFVNFKADPINEEDDDVIEEIESKIIIEEPHVDANSVVLTAEERTVIESCTDEELKTIMLLNRSKNYQLLKLLKRINNLIIDCEDALVDKDRHLKKLGQARPKGIYAQNFRLAAPYFKDKKFYKSPPNEDAIKKRSRGELTSYDLIRPLKWKPIEFDRLINGVKVNFNLNRQHEVVKKLNSFKAIKHKGEDKDESIGEKIEELEKTLGEMKSNEIVPPRNSDEFIDWSTVADLFVNDKHSPSECKAIWHILVHPDINKSDWSEEENANLEEIAKQCNYQDWDHIANELGTNRTAFMTCIHYSSKLNSKNKGIKFSPQEDQLIIDLVDAYKSGDFIPWNQITCHFDCRSHHQIYHRYVYFLSNQSVKRGKFSEAEDILLMILVKKFGKNFAECEKYMPHRSRIQLKSRYNTNLKHHVRKGTFTVDDDKTIMEFVKEHGEKTWRHLTVKMNRCSAQIRQRYKVISAFLKTNPNANIEEVPKRKHNFQGGDSTQYSFLRYMADQFKNIPTLESIENALKAEVDLNVEDESVDQVKDIDSMLVDYFKQNKPNQINTTHSSLQFDEAAKNMEKFLGNLEAHLIIPDDFECDSNLDSTDVEILKRLKGVKQESTPNKMLTPNSSTAAGLRSLIIKYKEYKTEQKYTGDMAKWEMEHELQSLDEVTKNVVVKHRDMFSKRFFSVFNWPAALSLEKPNLPDVSKSPEEVERNVKKRRIDIADINVIRNESQQPLVDKSIVDRLLNNSQLQILRIENIHGPDGIVRPVIRQPRGQIFRKTAQEQVVSEQINRNAIRDDVDKLNEILNLEKIKQESEFCSSPS